MDEKNKVKKRKVVLRIIILVFMVIVLFVFRYRDFIINIVHVRKLFKDENTYIQLYDTYTEYEIDANGRFDSNLDGIEFKSFKLNHCYDKLEKDHSSDGRSYMAKNEDDLFVIVYPEDKERVGLADYYGIPNRIRSYMVDTYGEEVLFDDYSLLKKAFEITPDDLSFFGNSRNKLVSNMALIFIKAMEVPRVFEYKRVFFESENIKGFQDGMPSEDSSVYLRIFDASGEVEESYYVLIIGGTTQEEVDMILNSVEFGNGMGGEYVFRAE